MDSIASLQNDGVFRLCHPGLDPGSILYARELAIFRTTNSKYLTFIKL